MDELVGMTTLQRCPVTGPLRKREAPETLFQDNRIYGCTCAPRDLEWRGRVKESVLPIGCAVVREIFKPDDFIENHAEIANERCV